MLMSMVTHVCSVYYTIEIFVLGVFNWAFSIFLKWMSVFSRVWSKKLSQGGAMPYSMYIFSFVTVFVLKKPITVELCLFFNVPTYRYIWNHGFVKVVFWESHCPVNFQWNLKNVMYSQLENTIKQHNWNVCTQFWLLCFLS